MKECLHESTIHAWIDGELSGGEVVAVRDHLGRCELCAGAAQIARQTADLLGTACEATLAAPLRPDRLRLRVESALKAASAKEARWAWLSTPVLRQAGAVVGVGTIIVLIILVFGPGTALRRREIPAPASPSAIAALPSDAASPVPLPPAVQPTSGVEEKPPQTQTVEMKPVSRNAAPSRPGRRAVETGRHVSEMLLLFRSIRNAEIDSLTDLAYERELSRELLARNRALRRSAGQKDQPRAEQLLGHIEPLLLDIANLSEQPAVEEMLSIKDMIREQQVIAELQLYAGGNLF